MSTRLVDLMVVSLQFRIRRKLGVEYSLQEKYEALPRPFLP